MAVATAASGSAQSDATQQEQQATPAQSERIQPQGYLDPKFNDATDKPHAGMPLQPNAAAPESTPPPAQTGNGDWYKSSPQAYDQAAPKPRRFHLPKSQSKVKVIDDSRPQEQIAQQESEPSPQSEEQRQYGYQQPQQDDDQRQYSSDQGQTEQPQYAPQQPQYTQPAPQYRQVQPVPQYYGQQGQQAYAQPQQDPGQDYADQDSQGQDDQPIYGPDDQQQAPAQPTQQPLNAQQLEQLVAPIALYPDQLVAQILTASTYPAQLTAADQWLRQMNNASPEQIASAVAGQTQWDPSIKALTAFPKVLDMLNSNLQWTAALGNAYYNQPQDVLNTVQALRDRAQQAGNLQSTPQEQVNEQPGAIQIEPTNPEYVYVPSYNPWYAYGAPIEPYPAFGFGDWGLYIGGGIRFGLGFAIQPFMGFGWGWGAWGCDWAGAGILYNHDYYWTRSREVRDWGFEHGGRRWEGGGRGWYNRGGRQMARYGDYHHEGIPVHGGNNLNREPLGGARGGPRQPMGRQNFEARGGMNGRENFGHVQGGPTRPENPRQQSFNHIPEAYGRPQPFQRGPQSFGNRPQAYSGPQGYSGGARPLGVRPEPYRSLPEPRGFNQGRPGNGYGQGYVNRPQPTQNFGGRQFGYARPGGGEPRSFGQSYGRPQQPMGGGFRGFGGGGHSAPSFGGGHSFNGGGGHSFGGGGHSFGGGGGHSFGGGGSHSFGGGGGHSFGGGGGGHSGGGHSGGEHHR